MKKIIVALLIALLLLGCSQLDREISACEEVAPEYFDQMADNVEEWEDTFEIALSTSRIALSGPVSSLQSIRRDAGRIEPIPCLEGTHERYLEGMDTMMDILLEFMADADATPNETDVTIAQLQIEIMIETISEYEDDPEAFFETLKESAATSTAEAED